MEKLGHCMDKSVNKAIVISHPIIFYHIYLGNINFRKIGYQNECWSIIHLQPYIDIIHLYYKGRRSEWMLKCSSFHIFLYLIAWSIFMSPCLVHEWILYISFVPFIPPSRNDPGAYLPVIICLHLPTVQRWCHYVIFQYMYAIPSHQSRSHLRYMRMAYWMLFLVIMNFFAA